LKFRAFILISLLAALSAAVSAQSIPADVQASISVSELRLKLADFLSAHSSQGTDPVAKLEDDNVAEEIHHLQLSERLTAATLKDIEAKNAMGLQAKQALQLLADRSALLDPPPSEWPNMPAPDTSHQQQMLEDARGYVVQTLARLPNFFATRTTERYYGIPPGLNEASRPVMTSLLPRGSYSREITFRDGKELIDPMKNPEGRQTLFSLGLETQGEFGTEAAVVLTDVTSNTIAFHHWEKGPTGVVAVFRYSVSKQDSHYEVSYLCNGKSTFHNQPAYHGAIALDPASSAIMRVTIEATDSNADDPVSHVASVVEYGPVEIGGKIYTCPLHSVAFSVVGFNGCSAQVHSVNTVKRMYLNRTTFTDYHRLGSTWRIVPETPAGAETPQP
jgi:hypothetical protein